MKNTIRDRSLRRCALSACGGCGGTTYGFGWITPRGRLACLGWWHLGRRWFRLLRVLPAILTSFYLLLLLLTTSSHSNYYYYLLITLLESKGYDRVSS